VLISLYMKLSIQLHLPASSYISMPPLEPLRQFGVQLPSSEAVSVANKFLMRNSVPHTITGMLDALFCQREAFPDTYKLIASIATFPCSTAICESAFAALSRIDRPQRRSMLQKRQANLSLLAFL